MVASACRVYSRRTPPGVRELKLDTLDKLLCPRWGRTPPGVRELKLRRLMVVLDLKLSHPSRGA